MTAVVFLKPGGNPRGLLTPRGCLYELDESNLPNLNTHFTPGIGQVVPVGSNLRGLTAIGERQGDNIVAIRPEYGIIMEKKVKIWSLQD